MKRLFLLAALVSAPAHAQDESQSVISTSRKVTNVRAYEELRVLGACVASSQRERALAVIAAEPNSAAEDAALRKSVYGTREDHCMWEGTKMSIPGVFARGVVAEGLLKAGVPDSFRLTAPSPAEVRNLHGAARCYTNGHRAQARALLEKKMGSPEEVQAVAALWGDFQACLGPVKARLNAPWVRLLVAEALLRLPPETTGAGE